MPTISVRKDDATAKIALLLQDIQELTRLEETSQEILKQPVEQMLDSAPDSLNHLEERKTGLMRQVDRHSIELIECRRRLGAAEAESPALREADGRLMLALRGLQRQHQDNERILRLRMTLLGEDIRNVERSRQFLRATLQSVAA